MIVGLGIDIIEISRVRKVYLRYPQRFLQKVLTPGERKYCNQFEDPVPEIAARFAAKEAFSKAIGTGMHKGVHWKLIEVVKERGEPPRIKTHGTATKHAERLGMNNIHMTITHTDRYAAVVVIGEKI